MGVIENVPRETFLSVNIFFKKNITYRTSSRLVHEKWPVHSADEVKASKKAYSSFPEKKETNAWAGGMVFWGARATFSCHTWRQMLGNTVT